MAGIEIKCLNESGNLEDYDGFGTSAVVTVGRSTLARSTLLPGWSWDRNMKPYAGLDACPKHHREYVISGRIHYRMTDGTEAEGKAGDHLVIQPGHTAEVVGDEPCVLLDW